MYLAGFTIHNEKEVDAETNLQENNFKLPYYKTRSS